LLERIVCNSSVGLINLVTRWLQLQGRRNQSPKFFQRIKSALFCDEKSRFVQANVAVNTKLTSKVPFLFGNFHVFLKKNCGKKSGQKRTISVWYERKKFLLLPPPVENISWKNFLGVLFNVLKSTSIVQTSCWDFYACKIMYHVIGNYANVWYIYEYNLCYIQNHIP
jgi:hypothetical protein